ncbi:MAG: DUF1643 domain-containing protein [Ktedonobacteraceae bacterium]|nr:DUF1643 domain-containing protein [Ktedonobacteraceae bacterium]
MQSGAVICGTYRYLLWREWNPDGPRVTFLMLNPSIADVATNDPTLRRCIGFAQTWGFGSLEAVNLFAYRAVSPQVLRGVADPVGLENDHYLLQAAARSACIVVAWGDGGQYHNRDRAVTALLLTHSYDLSCLGYTQSGCPRHPLYIRKGTERQCFPSF